MTKPRDFKYNSDYMSMGQTESVRTFTASVPQSTYQTQGAYIAPKIDNLDFNLPAVNGSIEEYTVEYNGTKYNCKVLEISATAQTGINSGYHLIILWRLNANTIRATFVRQHRSGSFATLDPAPAISVNVRVTTFRPPNLT